MTNRIYKGIFAGFIATVALSALMILKTEVGMSPQMNAIKMLSSMAHGFMGTPAIPVVGWLLHFIIGSILWGILFAILFKRIPGQTPAIKGLIFGTAAWLLMMIMVMPMAGAGLFGIHLGIGASIATLVLHWIFGAVLGSMYGKLTTPHFVATHTHA
jgi:uncharacterized membrane protein YagU involved in acid resistance